ncbi:hypothetical protein [Deinococcus cellulosilyticus]|uniref:Uncharacterized protein n=1 Tax=Deinococcus cellulosilyticus (strain DSM 18568 / NBRC 106333 / KACC 11606 / 5516J-15) TaxID=1223518 RepID=A0A511N302_DEIC1|nr:hypothetical protein [Deinococcus cellulosilyticus]GEM47229.1 hypothetical protein DC3_28640 [Deinococcus cellulosilyticus NBRC 106333 = KACC 11606]
MADSLLQRIEDELGVPDPVGLLSRLSLTDLTSLLLEVYRQKADQRTPAQVLEEYQQSRFVRPAKVHPVRMLEWEKTVLSSLPSEVEPLVLSPVAPLGTCSVVAAVDQNWSVSTVRGNEVVSDATNVLALEACIRRKTLLKENPKSSEVVHLATSQRMLRPQFYNQPGQIPHFNLFCMVSAGRDQGNSTFEHQALLLHLRTMLQALRRHWTELHPLKLTVSDFSGKTRALLTEERIFQPLLQEFSALECQHDPDRTHARNYYTGLCFHLYALPDGADQVFLADGGEVKWSQTLLSNSKERMLISGLGGDRVVRLAQL